MKLIRCEYPQSPRASAFNRLFDLGAPTMERFGSLLDDFFAESEPVGVDLYEDAHNFYARMELPGVKKDVIDLELENSVLTVRSQNTEKSDQAESSLSFNRSISVPDGITVDKVEATLEEGVLTVILPKAEARKPKQIKVK